MGVFEEKTGEKTLDSLGDRWFCELARISRSKILLEMVVILKKRESTNFSGCSSVHRRVIGQKVLMDPSPNK